MWPSGLRVTQVLLRRRQSLQSVEVVGHRRRRVGVGGEPVVPRGARWRPHRQHRRVGVQPCHVGRGGEVREDVTLAIAGIREQGQHLIAVAGEHHLVEPHGRAIAEGNRHVALAAPHAVDLRSLVNAASTPAPSAAECRCGCRRRPPSTSAGRSARATRDCRGNG